MITEKEYKRVQELRMLAYKIEDKIELHIHKALQVICKIYGGKLAWFDYPGERGADTGGLLGLGAETILIYTEHEKLLEEEPLYNEKFLLSEFPVEFLFLNLKEIKKLVIAERKEQSLACKKKKISIAERARLKLTKEEIKALGL